MTVTGSSIAPLIPGHPAESYLEALGTYKARFGNYVAALPHVTVLAENRSREPIALEITVARGAVFVVPPAQDADQRDQLKSAMNAILRSQLGQAHEWPLEEEETLRAERQKVLHQLSEHQFKDLVNQVFLKILVLAGKQEKKNSDFVI